MKEYVVSSREAGQRMDKYLVKVLDKAPKSFIYKMLRKKNIVLNDKKATGQEILAVSDTVKIYFSDDTFEKFSSAVGAVKKTQSTPDDFPEIPIIYEDENILILNKPAGVLSQKSVPSDYSANEWVVDHLVETGEIREEDLHTFRPSICNRLDRNTSGLLLAGKTIAGLQYLSRILKDRSAAKYYHCLVAGEMKKGSHLKGYLIKNHKTNQVRIYSEKEYQKLKDRDPGIVKEASYIETSYEPLNVYHGFSLLEVHLITGRSHQIRAHLSSVGHPILGDPKYGNRNYNRQLQKFGLSYQLLHAYRIEFPDGQCYVAREPELFDRIEKEFQIS